MNPYISSWLLRSLCHGIVEWVVLTAAANKKERVGHLKKKGASIEEFNTFGSEKPRLS